MFQLVRSASTKTGTAPSYMIGLALAENVSELHHTSSSRLTPNRRNPR